LRDETRHFKEWKEAKIAARLAAMAVKGGGAAPAPAEVPGPALSSLTPDTVDVNKMAHKFWSADATRTAAIDAGPKPNVHGEYDVKSFRAPSFTTEPVEYGDMEVKIDDPDTPPPLACEAGTPAPPAVGDASLPPAPGHAEAPPPALPPPVPQEVPGTDFDELD
jgi:hypothetical protein